MNVLIAIGIVLYCVIALREMVYSFLLGAMHHDTGFKSMAIAVFEGAIWPLTVAWRVKNRR